MDVGVYVHFPWCRRLCPYCDFPVVITAGEPPHRAYLGLVLAELADQAPRFAGRALATIYLGGGTPSWWDPACVAELCDAIRATFPGAPAACRWCPPTSSPPCTRPRTTPWAPPAQ